MAARKPGVFNPPPEKMSAKAFWGAVEKQLVTYSADELRAILRAMAQATLPMERQAFLDQLKPGKETAAAIAKALVLGWSSSGNPQGVVVPFCLSLLSGTAPGALPANLSLLWQTGLQSSAGFELWAETDQEESSLVERLERAHAEQLSQLSVSPARQRALLAWWVKVAKQRAKAIVGNKYRGSYAKAAGLIGACAEVLRLRGEAEAAEAIVDEARQRFPRHRAFQAELNAAIARTRHSRS